MVKRKKNRDKERDVSATCV